MQQHLTVIDLEAGLSELGASPQDHGKLEMIVCRPERNERKLLEHAQLDQIEGLVGDNWRARGSSRTEDGSAHPGMQLTLMNSRVIRLLAQERSRWSLAGDQLYVDLDLSVANLRPGQQLAVGSAVLEITDVAHTGCDKFTERYGHEAIRFVNSKEGRSERRRGIYARVIQSGSIAVGDTISKLDSPL